jgi:Protein of unknown function (DUF1488)
MMANHNYLIARQQYFAAIIRGAVRELGMPLKSGTQSPYSANVFDVGFGMLDNQTLVKVIVTDVTLLKLSGRLGKQDRIVACEQHRALLEKLASEKFDAGLTEPNGAVVIRSTDV